VSVRPAHQTTDLEAKSGASETALEVEQYWGLLHDLMNQLTTARLYTQRFLSRLQDGETPSDAEWREGLARIDRAALDAVGLIKGSLGARVVRNPFLSGRRTRR
jgi:hypothetical protein